ncbi:MAG: methyltransferase [Candidatus Sericytochromatia bacterium]|nr:methyltransferase [Candidatus Sericytochromatia bacterium]
MSEQKFSIPQESARVLDENISDLILYVRKNELEILKLIKSAMLNRNIEWEELSKYSILDFHRSNEANIFCLSKWNAEEKYQNIIRYIKYICKNRQGKILDFGGGIGELTINLASIGLDIDFIEVPGKTLEFAKWKFKRRALNINTYTSLNQLKERYDIIICLDVLEVLEKPMSHLKKFYQLLNKNGILILSVGDVGNKNHPMNLIQNKNFIDNLDIYCSEIGFIDSIFENKFHLKIKAKI